MGQDVEAIKKKTKNNTESSDGRPQKRTGINDAESIRNIWNKLCKEIAVIASKSM